MKIKSIITKLMKDKKEEKSTEEIWAKYSCSVCGKREQYMREYGKWFCEKCYKRMHG